MCMYESRANMPDRDGLANHAWPECFLRAATRGGKYLSVLSRSFSLHPSEVLQEANLDEDEVAFLWSNKEVESGDGISGTPLAYNRQQGPRGLKVVDGYRHVRLSRKFSSNKICPRGYNRLQFFFPTTHKEQSS
jgi:hypothetical protein